MGENNYLLEDKPHAIYVTSNGYVIKVNKIIGRDEYLLDGYHNIIDTELCELKEKNLVEYENKMKIEKEIETNFSDYLKRKSPFGNGEPFETIGEIEEYLLKGFSPAVEIEKTIPGIVTGLKIRK